MTGVQTCALPILFELVMAFEEEYGVSIPSEELENMATVGDVIRYIQEQA